LNPTRTLIGLLLMAVTMASCALPGAATPPPTTDPNSILTAAAGTAFVRLSEVAAFATPTASVAPTETQAPTATTILLPTSIPTIKPLPGVMRANANVRGIPGKSKAHDVGGLMQGQNVGVIGRNAEATWLYIIYADSPTGTGWVTVKAITLDADMGLLPILIYPNGQEELPIMLPPFLFYVTGTPLPPAPPPADWPKYGTLIQPANVRIGPSVGFLSMGILQPGQKVTFRGRIEENAWVQIDYPSGPDGKGWILAELLQANDGFGGLPYYDVLGTPVTPTPQGPAATQELNSAPAPTETATPAPPSANGAEGEVTAQINVRKGPAQSYDSLGLLNPKDKVTITGLTLNNLWYQIEYPASPDGSGWISAQYIKVLGDMRNLPYYNDLATKIP